VIEVVRADEAHHRDVNHAFANEIAGLPSLQLAPCPPHVPLDPQWMSYADPAELKSVA
jgi:ubiquinol oxidase